MMRLVTSDRTTSVLLLFDIRMWFVKSQIFDCHKYHFCHFSPATLSTDPSMSATPPFGFHPGPKGIYYRAFWDHVTFDRATEMCEEAGGVLSRVFDKESNDQIQRYERVRAQNGPFCGASVRVSNGGR